MKYCTLLFWLLIGSVAFAQNNQLTGLEVTTGGTGGTYIHIGQDIKSLCRDNELGNLSVTISEGSLENVTKLVDSSNYPNTVFGLVQKDIIAYVNLPGNETLAQKANRSVRMLLPLYYEHVHVLVREDSGYDTIEALINDGTAQVWAGRMDSGSMITASVIEQEFFNGTDRNNLWKLQKKTSIQSLEQAADELRARNIQGILTVSVAPVKALTDPQVYNGLKLLPAGNLGERRDLQEAGYITETLDVDSTQQHGYSWIGSPTPVLTIPAVLACRSYNNLSITQRQAIPPMMETLCTNLRTLQSNTSASRQWLSADRVISEKRNWTGGLKFYGTEESSGKTNEILRTLDVVNPDELKGE